MEILFQIKEEAMERIISDSQLERLCALVYLNELFIHRNEGTLGEIVNYILEYGLKNTLPCLMTETEWLRVLYDIKDDPALSRLWIIKVVDTTEPEADGTLPGHRAFAFEDVTGNVYAVFRGTGSDDEWYDNALGMTESDTPQQLAAARFVTELKQEKPSWRIITAGHSKGGNKAQYAAVTTKGIVDYSLSVDGQGFSPAFMAKYSKDINERKNNMTLIAERRGFVHCLGLYAHTPVKYHSGRRDGQPLPYFHCPDALRGTDGNLGPVSYKAPFPEMLNELTAYFLNSPKYKDIRHDTAADLVALMMANKKTSAEETTEALVNLGIVFMDLTNTSVRFRQHVEDVFVMESELLLATFESAGQGEPGSGLRKHVSEILTRRILTDMDARKNFIGTLRYLRRLMRRLKTHKQLKEYVVGFMEMVLRNLL
jgi:hypothetical protein